MTTTRKVPALNGWRWINEGVRYFMSDKFIWMLSLFFVLFFSVFLINIIPMTQLLLMFVFPFIAAGMSLACAGIEKGEKMTMGSMFMAFSHPNRMNLFRYGLLLLLLIIIAQMMASIVLGMMGVNLEMLNSELNGIKDNPNASIHMIFASPILLKFFVVTVISMIPIVMINLLAPILLVFSEMTAWQSVKLSFLAGFKNLPALALYAAIFALILFILVIIFNLLLQLLTFILGADSLLAVYLYLFLFVMAVLVVVSVSYSSAYVAVKDMFLGEDF